ncbi:MAG: hypothetical protein GY765_29070 [bacterium]|nr:hypothetical protein [bacterium]
MSEQMHIWHHCHSCGAGPIIGTRHHCVSCPDGPDNDLCEKCFDRYQKEMINHPAEKSLGSTLNIKEHHFDSIEGKPGDQYDSWPAIPHPKATAPNVPDSAVVRPIFSVGTDSFLAGYAFAAKTDKNAQPLLFTALHVMDELIKKKGIDSTVANTGYNGKEIPKIITSVDLFDVFAPNWMMACLGSAGPMLVLPDARTDEEEPFSDKDIAVFKISEPRGLKPLLLAENPPEVGDPVWMVAQVPDITGKAKAKATVVEVTDRSMIFKFEVPKQQPQYSSGSPVLDKKGHVVGITVGGGKVKGLSVGHCNHVINIRKHLTSA